MFFIIWGVDRIDENYSFFICKGFFNIYYLFDLVVYRLEFMIVLDLDLKVVFILYYKGRKRFYLELKESFFCMGFDLK